MVDDTTVTYENSTVIAPNVVASIFSNGKIAATGQSEPIYIGGSQKLLLMITLGAKTSTPNITFHIKVFDNNTNDIVGLYDYTSSALSTGEETTAVTVDESSETPLGNYIEVSWTGTLTETKYFSGCYIKLIAK